VTERRREIQARFESWLPGTTDENDQGEGGSQSQGVRAASEQSSRDEISQVGIEDAREIDDAEGQADPKDFLPPSSHAAIETARVPNDTQPVAVPDAATPDGSPDRPNVSRPAEAPDSWSDLVYSQFDPGTVISLAARLAGSIGNLLSNAVLIMLTVVFILLEAGSFADKLRRAFSRRAASTQQVAQIVSSVQRYMAIKTMMSLATAILIGVWLKMLGFLMWRSGRCWRFC